MGDLLGTIFILGCLGLVALVFWYKITTCPNIEPELELAAEQGEPIPSTLEETAQAEVAAYERNQLSKIGL